MRLDARSISVAAVTAGLVALVLFSPPRGFPSGAIVSVEAGSLGEVAEGLRAAGVVRFPTVVKLVALAMRADSRLQAGDYVFERSLGVFGIVRRVSRGVFGVELARVRLPEGGTRAQFAEILAGELDTFDANEFLTQTGGEEGYLFPDTYFFPPNVSAENVVRVLRGTFERKTESVKRVAAERGRAFDELVILASLIAREAHDAKDQRLIAGVLENRLALGMPLQVDAPFFFLLGKASSELTRDDLALDSPFNTYTNPGLPPAPIGNPGLDALSAALDPEPSEYLYYLADADGVTHFAETFDAHKLNRIRYLEQ